MQVEAQQVAGGQRARAHQPRRRQALDRARGAEGQRRRQGRARRLVDARRGSPTSRTTPRASRAARRCRRRPGATKPRGRTPARRSTRRPASTARRVSSPSRPRNSAAGLLRRGAAAEARCWKPCWAMASPRAGALGQPLHHLGPAVVEGVQVGRRDDEQRHALDPVVVEPVADERAALEGRGLDVVQGDGDRARAPHAAQLAQVVELLGEEPVPAQAPGTARPRRRGPARAARAAAMAAASPSVSPGAKRCARSPRSPRARRRRAGHDARAAGRGLERDEAEGLVLAGHDHAARARRTRAPGARGRRRTGWKATRRAMPQRPRAAAQRVLGRARADQPQRPRVVRARRGLQQPEDALLARQPPDVEDVVAARDAGLRAEGVVQAQAQREARLAPAVGLGVDDGGDRVDRRVGVAQPRAEERLPRARRARACRRRRARPSRGGRPPPWPRARGRPR